MPAVSEKDLFRDKFGLYLAVGLMGPSRVIEYLKNDERKERPVIPLYWRSKLMIPDASRMLCFAEANSGMIPKSSGPSKLLFFDVKVEFVKKQHQQKERVDGCDAVTTEQQPFFKVLVSLGFFLLIRNRERPSSENDSGEEIGVGHYVCTQALDYEQFISHITSLQLDPQSVTAEALASSMAEEFLRQGPPSSLTGSKKLGQAGKNYLQLAKKYDVLDAKYVSSSNGLSSIQEEKIRELENSMEPTHPKGFDGSTTNCSLSVVIPYKNMGNTNGTFLLKLPPEGVTKFNRSALRFLHWDFSKNQNHFQNAESLSSMKELVEEAFNHWQTRVDSRVTNDKDDTNSSKQSRESNDDAVAIPAPAGNDRTRNKNKHKKRRAFNGMAVLPSARRKRNKGLVYDAK